MSHRPWTERIRDVDSFANYAKTLRVVTLDFIVVGEAANHVPAGVTSDKQKRIAGSLNAVDRKLRVEQSRWLGLDALFKSLLHHLMTRKVRLHDEPL